MAIVVKLQIRRKAIAALRKQAARPENFADVMARLTCGVDWSEATAEDEHAAALAAYDILCNRPSARRSIAAA